LIESTLSCNASTVIDAVIVATKIDTMKRLATTNTTENIRPKRDCGIRSSKPPFTTTFKAHQNDGNKASRAGLSK